MSTARSVFTEAIEDHLALKKQNTGLEATMPLARYDVGDPLDRYPGGPNRAADGTVVIAEDLTDAPAAEAPIDEPFAAEATQLMVGPSPEQAMEAATALEPAFADRPFEPLTGMTPMLSLVEDIEDEDEAEPVTAPAEDERSGDVLRFPGGVGPREDVAVESAAQQSFDTHSMPVVTDAVSADAIVHDAPTGEQPVLVIDTDEPLATSDFAEPAAPRSSRRKPRFFGLGGKKRSQDESAGEGWFTDGPRDFNWD
jgi:hypothetical protein